MKISPTSFQRYSIFILLLVGIGLLATWTIHRALSLVNVVLPWWIETPSTLGVAGILYAIYHKYLWPMRVFRFFGITEVPDIRGRWEGTLHSSFSERRDELPAVIEIHQSASDIKINLYTSQSRSSSVVANFSKDIDRAMCLHYTYLNEINGLAAETMHTHYGSVHLRYYPDVRKLVGEYYTSRQRGNYGEMNFKFSRGVS